ncbi:hypothetical protein QR685DRAFT_607027 [Neurospora intermedia]|uniref:Uncharacterized protein n=1 Tax=Neurospora intermedia TaxID=5142 RepID=A0ABR3DDL2_NEUIN
MELDIGPAEKKFARFPLFLDRRVTENGKNSYSELLLRHCAPHDETCHRVQIPSAGKVLEKERRRNLVSPRRYTYTSFELCLYVGLLTSWIDRITKPGAIPNSMDRDLESQMSGIHDELHVAMYMAKQEAAFAGLSNPSTYHRPRPTILRNTRLTADTTGPGALVQGLLSPSRYRRKLINPLRTFRARKACYGPTGRPAFDFHNAHRFKSVRPSRPRHDALAGPQRQEKRVDAQRQGLGRGNPRTKTGVSTPPVWPYLPHKPGAFNHGCREDGRVNSLIASTLGRPLDKAAEVARRLILQDARPVQDRNL